MMPDWADSVQNRGNWARVAWCKRHKDKVLACYLLIPDSPVIPVYIVGTSEQYDFELTKELSQLASEFDERGWSVHVSQIPRCEAEELS